MFKMPSLGILLLACHILASLTVGLLFRFYGENLKHNKDNYKKKKIIKILSKNLKLNLENYK